MRRKDDEYEGYFFEAGTVFTVNQWANHLDPKEHEDPYTFNPDRYLDEHLYDGLQGHWGFGVGRRVCVGWSVAVRNMWMVFSRLLYCFDFIEDPVPNPPNELLISGTPNRYIEYSAADEGITTIQDHHPTSK